MTQMYDKVRELRECPLCGLPKVVGSLLCWPCHHREKERHRGDYSRDTYTKFIAIEGVKPQSQKGAS